MHKLGEYLTATGQLEACTLNAADVAAAIKETLEPNKTRLTWKDSKDVAQVVFLFVVLWYKAPGGCHILFDHLAGQLQDMGLAPHRGTWVSVLRTRFMSGRRSSAKVKVPHSTHAATPHALSSSCCHSIFSLTTLTQAGVHVSQTIYPKLKISSASAESVRELTEAGFHLPAADAGVEPTVLGFEDIEPLFADEPLPNQPLPDNGAGVDAAADTGAVDSDSSDDSSLSLLQRLNDHIGGTIVPARPAAPKVESRKRAQAEKAAEIELLGTEVAAASFAAALSSDPPPPPSFGAREAPARSEPAAPRAPAEKKRKKSKTEKGPAKPRAPAATKSQAAGPRAAAPKAAAPKAAAPKAAVPKAKPQRPPQPTVR